MCVGKWLGDRLVLHVQNKKRANSNVNVVTKHMKITNRSNEILPDFPLRDRRDTTIIILEMERVVALCDTLSSLGVDTPWYFEDYGTMYDA